MTHQGGKEISIPFAQILYAEQKNHALCLYLSNGETVTINQRLDCIESQFTGQTFFRCHKSFLVNLAYVAALDRELMVFTMKNGKNVHIRRESLSKARKAFEGYLFQMVREIADE